MLARVVRQWSATFVYFYCCTGTYLVQQLVGVMKNDGILVRVRKWRRWKDLASSTRFALLIVFDERITLERASLFSSSCVFGSGVLLH